jgi:hypothetical protein
MQAVDEKQRGGGNQTNWDGPDALTAVTVGPALPNLAL